jgi:acetyl-CoA carboxylase biotin carboxyl carrier protein
VATRSEAAAEDSTAEEAVRLEVDGRTGGGIPDLEFVRGLIAAVDDSGIDSLEITRAGTRVKISKTPPAGPAPVHYAAPPAAPAPAPNPGPATAAQAAETAATEPVDGASAEASDAASGLIEITSPMVGTFYRAPAPDAPPYVEPGTRVRQGQTLCILEAMKLMNELESETDGVIREVLVENADPVEYGQVLFLVEPG